jgi:hypothetical protein
MSITNNHIEAFEVASIGNTPTVMSATTSLAR